MDAGREGRKLHRPGTLVSNGVYLVPELLTPVDERLHVPLDVLRTLPTADGVDFDGDFLSAKPAQWCTDTGVQERFPVPRHAEFHDLRECRVATEERRVSYQTQRRSVRSKRSNAQCGVPSTVLDASSCTCSRKTSFAMATDMSWDATALSFSFASQSAIQSRKLRELNVWSNVSLR